MTQAYTLGMAITLYGLSRLGDDGDVKAGGGQGVGNRWSEADMLWFGGMRSCFGSVLSVFMMGGEHKAVLATAAVGLVALLLYSAAALVAVSDAFRFGDDIANYDSQVLFGMWGLLSMLVARTFPQDSSVLLSVQVRRRGMDMSVSILKNESTRKSQSTS
jgi:hypothetical protein